MLELELELGLEAGKGLEPGLEPRAPSREPQVALVAGRGLDPCGSPAAAAPWLSCHSNRGGWRVGLPFSMWKVCMSTIGRWVETSADQQRDQKFSVVGVCVGARGACVKWVSGSVSHRGVEVLS